jgi:hypothetical protein
VAQSVRLVQLYPKVRKKLSRDNFLTRSHLEIVAGLKDERDQTSLIEDIKRMQLDVEDTRRRAKSYAKGPNLFRSNGRNGKNGSHRRSLLTKLFRAMKKELRNVARLTPKRSLSPHQDSEAQRARFGKRCHMALFHQATWGVW